jgi:hypothetical protein
VGLYFLERPFTERKRKKFRVTPASQRIGCSRAYMSCTHGWRVTYLPVFRYAPCEQALGISLQ